MRSKWSAEVVLLFLATAALEGAWLTLVNIALQWLRGSDRLDLGIFHFCIAVGVGMVVARSFRHLSQARYAVVITAAAIVAGVLGALLSGTPTTDVGAFLRSAVLDPGAWLLGVAVVRGASQADPGAGYETERVFSLGIPGLALFWLVATTSSLDDNASFATAAFAASLSFVTAGLLALGLGRLKDLGVDAVDQAARRRWLTLVLAIVVVVLLIGIPLAGVLGLPVSSVIAGVLGPLAPVLLGVLSILAIPIFAFLSFLAALLKPNGLESALPSPPGPLASSGAPAPIVLPQTGAAPDLTLLLIAFLFVGALVLLRLVTVFMRRPGAEAADSNAVERRVSEPMVLPSLPRLPRLRLPRRRPTPSTATEAYVLSLGELARGPHGRQVGETPREHAMRVLDTAVGRDIGRLATDYQLAEMVGVRLTARESRRALERWRRLARHTGRRG